jgi:large subunit ribosomal protein L1
MDHPEIQNALEEIKQQPKKKFLQSYDLIINLKSIDIKTNPIDVLAVLPYSKGTKTKICAFVDQELVDQANKFCDLTIRESDFPKYLTDKKLAKKLAEKYDYFIAQMNIMPKLAAVFGKALGTRGKMPNPKLGCVVPPNANLEQLIKKLNQSVRLVAKKATNIQCQIGKENQLDKEIIENVISVYNQLLKSLPQESQNIKSVLIKTTMGKPVRI